jgi:hypothetical protein
MWSSDGLTMSIAPNGHFYAHLYHESHGFGNGGDHRCRMVSGRLEILAHCILHIAGCSILVFGNMPGLRFYMLLDRNLKPSIKGPYCRCHY